MVKEEDFQNISSTALLCTKFRAEYTSISYAKEIYELAKIKK